MSCVGKQRVNVPKGRLKIQGGSKIRESKGLHDTTVNPQIFACLLFSCFVTSEIKRPRKTKFNLNYCYTIFKTLN
jgi:hypothetical protein